MTAVGVATFLLSSAAPAYTIQNELSTGCHEEITTRALRAVRLELATAAPLPVTEDEKALVDDLQFTPAPDMRDLGGATLLASVRDNDLKGLSSDDLTALAEVHGNAMRQEEHCLRGLDQTEPGGSAAAVASCRAFIRGRAMEAIAGLDAAGMPDLGNRTGLSIHLSIRGPISAPLPTYYVRIGQAVHAIEDSFTHTYRTPDQMQITVVLNWLAQVNGTLAESRDGPGHASALDRCDDADALRKTRHQLATAAATEFFRATLDPQKSPAEKLAAVDAVLDKYVSYSPGCSFANEWCHAPEVAYANPKGCGCGVAPTAGGTRVLVAGLSLAFLTVARRRRRRPRGTQVGAAMTLAGAILFASSPVRAQSTKASTSAPDPAEPTTTSRTEAAHPATSHGPSTPTTTITKTTTPALTPGTPATTATTVTTPTTTTTVVTAPREGDGHQPPPPTIIPVKEPGPRDVTAMAFGGYIGASASIDKLALAGTAGARLRVSKHWTFGLDGETNPWLSVNGTPIRAGAINVYGSAMLRFPLAYENFNLRTTASLGTSYLLTNLSGAPSGSVGLYFGVSFLGIEWKLSRAFYLVINPLNFAMPIPQLQGVPLLYPQYRFSIGLEGYGG